jgi:hypothetical protein
MLERRDVALLGADGGREAKARAALRACAAVPGLMSKAEVERARPLCG